MNQAVGKAPGGYLFEEDYDAGFLDSGPKQIDEAAIRREANMVNGGEVALAACPKCGGSGYWRQGYPCFKCKGKGRVGIRVAAAAKGKATKEANKAKWMANHAAEIAYARKRADKGSGFYSNLLDKLAAYGNWTEGQLGVIQRDIAKDAEFWAAKKAEQAAAAPVIEISAIEKLFAKAVDNDVKRPIFRAEGLEISKAPVSGKNAGALYVKREGEYAGKIVDGKFHKVYAAKADTVDLLMAVAADPLAAAMAYGRRFGNCALCGRDLVDPVSIRAQIGPICAPKWGLDWKREAAREELEAEKDDE